MAVAIAGRARDRDQRQHGTAHDAQWKQPLAWAEARAHRSRYGEGEEDIPRLIAEYRREQRPGP